MRKVAIAATSVFAIAATTLGFTTTVQAAPMSKWDRLAQCESSGNWHINTGNGFTGGLQFVSSTWWAYGGGQYASSAHLASKWEQIAIAEKVLNSQGPNAWPICSKVAGL